MELELEKALGYARAAGLTDRHIAAAVNAAADTERFARDDGQVEMTHKTTGGRIRVHPGAVEQHELAGWQLKTEPKAKEK